MNIINQIMIIKNSLLFLFLVSTLISCRALQYGSNYPEESKFINITSMGLPKKDFVAKYGNPTSLIIQTDGSEKLYYSEKLQTVIVTTIFTFKKGVLVEMELLNISENFQPYMDSIRWEIRTH